MTSRLCFQVYLGPQRPLWDKCVASVEAYCARHGIEHYVQREPVLRTVPGPPRVGARAPKLGYAVELEKLVAWALLRGYSECSGWPLSIPYANDEIAVIDADVYVKPDAPNIFDAVPAALPSVALAAVVERDMPLTRRYLAKVERYADAQYGDPEFSYFNLGVTVLRPQLLGYLGPNETVEQFVRRPEFEKYVNGEGAYRWSTEQTLVNAWLAAEDVETHAFDWRWNCLYGAVAPESLAEAHFVHFILSSRLPPDADPEALIAQPRAHLR